MILIDYPYVSPFLIKTIQRNSCLVVRTPEAESLLAGYEIPFVELDEAVRILKRDPAERVYTNSENALVHIGSWESWYAPAKAAKLFKDKAAFREHLRHMFPGFQFRAVSLEGLQRIPFDELPLPFIIKPSTGFFSLGVHMVDSRSAWERVCKKIAAEAEEIRRLYPSAVVETSQYIIEECIEGAEYAVDAYYDDAGEPVILGIYAHLFSSVSDVSDRVYITSVSIMREMHDRVLQALMEINSDRAIRDFPFHAEMRLSDKHGVIPIEINPMRFGGWCTTADLCQYAYGFNQYEYYLQGLRPRWEKLLSNVVDDIYSIIVLDNSTGIPADQITAFSFDRLAEDLSMVLEYRPIDYRIHNVFGFVFARTPKAHMDELYRILGSDLKEYVSVS